MSSDSTGVQLGGPKERGNCCSSDYKDHEHQHILSQIAPCNWFVTLQLSRIVSVLTIDKHTEYFSLTPRSAKVGKHIVVVLPMRALCAKYQWHGTTEDVVNVQKVSCLFWQ
uniref:Uncharacterized protein n=1 Tax=Populus alba TaxID=43335 RepID=A0A4U5Q1B1_POPAL|nr:hypothetical protein D5086_0000152980 [Populus alba]